MTGTLAGLLGVGGGIIVVPALMLLFGASDLIAKGTSLLMMIPTAISGTVGNVRRHNVDLFAAALIGVAGMHHHRSRRVGRDAREPVHRERAVRGLPRRDRRADGDACHARPAPLIGLAGRSVGWHGASEPRARRAGLPADAPYLVGREKVREFARAVFADDPQHTDPDAAQALGYADVVAPPTFAIVVQEHTLAAAARRARRGHRPAERPARRAALPLRAADRRRRRAHRDPHGHRHP